VASTTLTVVGAAPVVDAIDDQTVGAGVPLSVTAVVRDTSPAPGGYRATIDWGDGAGALEVAFVDAGASPGASGVRIVRAAGLAAVGTVPLSRTYAAPGRYTAVLTVCDTACTEVRFQVAVTPSIVRLPSTGAAPLPVLWFGFGTLGAGVALVAVSRRRRVAR
jgi:LPXTG-motif cell wall-anchored protein